MRIAVISDIHGNLPALEAVMGDLDEQSPDEVWCGGDIGWAGPWATECIGRIRETGWPTVRGNTDVWITGDPQTVEDLAARRELEQLAAAHDISDDDSKWLASLPLGHSGPSSTLLVHGTPDTPFDAPMPDGAAGEFSPYEGVASVVIYGHVHRAFFRRLADGTIVCNTGSVGLPMDSPLPSYLLIDTTGPDIAFRHRRVDYDRAGAIRTAKGLRNPVADRFLELVAQG
ncbi:MAG: metallophosphoesterase family protein [Actinobacteria bacterium]|nr:metallophosphoesterase family protein [Actinomycetota bacterium]